MIKADPRLSIKEENQRHQAQSKAEESSRKKQYSKHIEATEFGPV